MLNTQLHTTLQTVHYFVVCKALGICEVFGDYNTAYTFATQLEQDFPLVSVERYKNTQFFDSWGDDTGGNV